MEDYRIMYNLLFNKITDALEEIAHLNFGTAQDLLRRAQQETEEIYLCENEQIDSPDGAKTREKTGTGL